MQTSLQTTSILEGRFAVGMVWRPLVSSGTVPIVALKRAKEEKARLYAHDGATAVVGLAHLGKKQVPRGTVYSLASMAARAFPTGEAIFALRVGDHWWVGAAASGVPVADTVFAEAGEALGAIEDLQARRKTAVVHCDPEIDFPQATELHVDQLAPMQTPESALRPVAAQLPAVVYLAAAMLVGFAAYSLIWPKYKARFMPVQLQTAPPIDALAEWTTAQNTWVKSVKAAVGSDLDPLKRAIFGLPLDVGGWQLVGASCVLGEAWECTVKYTRPTGMDSDSTNLTFEKARPADWKVAWKGASDLAAAFEVTGTVTTPFVPATHAQVLTAYQIDTYSEFQILSKPFNKVEVPDMVRVDIPAPRDREGKPIPRPSSDALPEFFRAQVSFDGPLRNIEVAQGIKAPVFWREVNTLRGKADKPGLHKSEFHTVMKGEIYARTR